MFYTVRPSNNSNYKNSTDKVVYLHWVHLNCLQNLNYVDKTEKTILFHLLSKQRVVKVVFNY